MSRTEYKSGKEIGECIYLYDIPSRITPSGQVKRRALFECMFCQTKFITDIANVKYGDTTSCGCEKKRITVERNSTHKLRKDPLYYVWSNIKKRCLNVNDSVYHNYGGRGIIICDEWKNDFKAFHDHVIGLVSYGEFRMTLDRIDNDGNYEPGNVRWATPHEQTINQRIRKNNTSGYVGVYPKLGRYAAQITIMGNTVHFGVFDTPIEAVTTRNNYITENDLSEYPIQKNRKLNSNLPIPPQTRCRLATTTSDTT